MRRVGGSGMSGGGGDSRGGERRHLGHADLQICSRFT
jgi:hypothetical protein